MLLSLCSILPFPPCIYIYIYIYIYCCGPAQRSPGGASTRRRAPAAGCSVASAGQLTPDGSATASTTGERVGQALVDPATGDQEKQEQRRRGTSRKKSVENRIWSKADVWSRTFYRSRP